MVSYCVPYSERFLESPDAGGESLAAGKHLLGNVSIVSANLHSSDPASPGTVAFDERTKREALERERERWVWSILGATRGLKIDLSSGCVAAIGRGSACLACKGAGHIDKDCGEGDEIERALALFHRGVVNEGALARVMQAGSGSLAETVAALEAFQKREHSPFVERETGVCEFCRATFPSGHDAASHKRHPSRCPVRLLAAVTVRVALGKSIDEFGAWNRTATSNEQGKIHLRSAKRNLESAFAELRQLNDVAESVSRQCEAMRGEQKEIDRRLAEQERALKRGKK